MHHDDLFCSSVKGITFEMNKIILVFKKALDCFNCNKKAMNTSKSLDMTIKFDKKF